MKLAARNDLEAPRLAELAALDDGGFGRMFVGSPVTRIGRTKFLRNVLIAIGNADAAELAPSARRLLHDPSSLVRGAAVWAMRQLLGDGAAADRRQSLSAETDEMVRAEWRA
jgi:epoxyqueuosine reductase